MQELNRLSNPFRGLRPFEATETHLFFGRDGQSEKLLRRLRRTRFLAVVGTSGSGKSSLVRAGLLPALQGGLMASAGSDWRIAVLRPGKDPVGNLARALASPEVLGSRGDKSAGMQEALAETTLRRSSLGLSELVGRARTKLDEAGQPLFHDYENLLIVVDQFEEIFRFKQLIEREKSNEDAAVFVQLLLEAVREADGKIYVVLTMRSDFLGDCAQFRGLPEAINNGQYLIPRMTRDERREAICGPIAVGRGAISEPLTNQLLNDMGDNPDQLPILQHALMRTWNYWLSHRRNGEPIDIPHYESIGGMSKALSQHADEAYEELDQTQKVIAEKLFKGLTEKGPDNREIRHPMTVREICEVTGVNEEAVSAVVEVFSRAGRSFLVPPPPIDPTTGELKPLKRDALLDISHESLIRNWGRLKTWVEEEARSARNYRRLAETAVLYSKGQAGLWRTPDLQVALNWREQSRPNRAWALRYHPEFELAQKFLYESVEARNAERAAEEARRRKMFRLATLAALILGMALLVSLVMGVSAYRALQRVEMEAAKNKHLLYISDINLAAQAYESSNFTIGREALESHFPETEEGVGFEWYLLWHLYHKDLLATFKQGAKSTPRSINSVAFSPDGKMLATGGGSLTVRLWDAASYEEIATLNEDKSSFLFSPGVNAVAFSPDGKILAAVGSSENTVRLWDTASRKELAPLSGHSASATSVTFSPNGKTLASGSDDGTVILWDAEARQARATLGERHPGGVLFSVSVSSVAFSPDGETLAAGYSIGTVKLWNVKTAQEVANFEPNAAEGLFNNFPAVSSIAFSPDSKTLAAGRSDTTVTLWDVKSKQKLGVLSGHSGYVRKVAFSRNGTLASVGDDKTVRLWDVASRRELFARKSREGFGGIAFSPDGKTLATGDGQGALMLWNVNTQPEPAVLGGFKKTLQYATFVQGGRMVAASVNESADIFVPQTVTLWDIASGQEITTIRGESPSIQSAAFSPDGKTLATGFFASGNPDKTVTLWDIASGRRVRYINALSVTCINISPDGKTLAVGSNGASVRLYDITSGRELSSLSPTSRPGISSQEEMEERAVKSVAFSPDGKTLAAGLNDTTIMLWDIASAEVITTLRGHAGPVLSVAFSPNGKTIATGSSDKTVRLWDIASGRELVNLKGHTGLVSAVAFSPDGKTLLTGDDKTVRLWHGATAEEVAAQRSKSF